MPRVTRGYGLLEGFLARQRSRTADRLIPAGHRAGRLLDIGCGSHPFFLSRVDFAEKFGLDKAVGPNRTDLSGLGGIRLVRWDIETTPRLPFDGASFDVVTMLAVFEHLEPGPLAGLLGEVHRVLKPGGVYIMTTPAAWTDRLLRLMARTRLVSPAEIDEHKGAYTPGRIAPILEAAGFAAQGMRFGYFEAGMNIWARAIR